MFSLLDLDKVLYNYTFTFKKPAETLQNLKTTNSLYCDVQVWLPASSSPAQTSHRLETCSSDTPPACEVEHWLYSQFQTCYTKGSLETCCFCLQRIFVYLRLPTGSCGLTAALLRDARRLRLSNTTDPLSFVPYSMWTPSPWVSYASTGSQWSGRTGCSTRMLTSLNLAPYRWRTPARATTRLYRETRADASIRWTPEESGSWS